MERRGLVNDRVHVDVPERHVRKSSRDSNRMLGHGQLNETFESILRLDEDGSLVLFAMPRIRSATATATRFEAANVLLREFDFVSHVFRNSWIFNESQPLLPTNLKT